MPISYKNKLYTTLGTPTTLSGDVVSSTDNAGVPAKDYTVKGKTIVWNQLFRLVISSSTSSNGVTISNNQDGTMTLSGTVNKSYINFANLSDAMNQAHKYLLCLKILNNPDNVSFYYSWLNRNGMRTGIISNGESCAICNQTEALTQGGKSTGLTGFTAGTVFNNVKVAVMVMDLTQMFGSGNEPATPAEFRAMFPDDYYPYNAGELKTIVPTSIEASGVERFQLVDKSKFTATTTIGNVTFTNNGDGTITVNGTARESDHIYYDLQNTIEVPVGHKVLISGGVTGASWSSYLFYDFSDTTHGIDAPGGGKIYTVQTSPVNPFLFVAKGYTVSNVTFKPQIFDLTKMFGAGNEPATVAQFWQRVPEKLYGYNPNDYKSANIPSSKYFPDGMKSAGSAYDEINFLSQKAIKRVCVVDMGTLNWDSNSGQYPTNSFYSGPFADAKKPTYNVISNGKFNALRINANGYVIAATARTEIYNSSEDFKAAMSGVMLYYELATPVETEITPPLQALSTYKGFTSFSAPNSLMQNGPLSVTYYAEGGANPESGWLTSYKRKLYMGRNIEWNQLVDKSKFRNISSIYGISITNNNDGLLIFNGTKTQSAAIYFDCGTYQIVANHKYYLYGAPAGSGSNTYQLYSYFTPTGGSNVFFFDNGKGVFFSGQATTSGVGHLIIFISKLLNTVSRLVFKPQLFDLTQMFGVGNEPTTVAEFWSYFDRKIYPYNAGETQPLFKISRKSRWGSI